ncbi:hypothetical protein K438DRAFT_1781853 [Mycena galopus ATCC 62051]|nr:hypothetical protein K438DRAFT_1781853 [Mycena galopus ATCC 62051]
MHVARVRDVQHLHHRSFVSWVTQRPRLPLLFFSYLAFASGMILEGVAPRDQCSTPMQPSFGDNLQRFHAMYLLRDCVFSRRRMQAQADPNHVIPSWVVVMAADTPSPANFDAAVASAIATGGSADTPPPVTVSLSPSSSSTTGSFNTSPPAMATANPSPSASSPAGSLNSSSSNPTSITSSSPSPTSTTASSPPLASSASSGSSEIPTGSAQLQSSTHRNTVQTAAIAGIVIAVLAILMLGTWLLWHRRRRRHQDVLTPFVGTFSPITINTDPNYMPTDKPDVRSKGEVAVRRWYLRKELRTAQERILAIQKSGPRITSPGPRATTSRFLHIFSTASRRTSTLGPQSPDSNVISELTARIRDLEAQMRSQWAQGLSDEAPPGYSQEGSP